MSDNRAIAYRENGLSVFRASSVGRAVRCLTSALQGYDPLPAPDYLIKAAEAGNLYEDIVKTELAKQGWVITGDQHVVELPVGSDCVIRGHTDGWHALNDERYGDESFVLEVKSMSQRVFDKWTAHRFGGFAEYAAQITVYMEAAQRRGVYVVINRDNPEQMETIILDGAPAEFETTRKKVLLAHHYWTQKQLPECDSESQYSCPYDFLCDRKIVTLNELDAGDDETLSELVKEYDRLRDLEKDLEAQKQVLRDEIAQAMGDRKKTKIDGFTVQFQTKTYKRLDAHMLRVKLGDELDDYYKESESVSMVVTAPKKGKK